jgi:poly-beta-1,6-N-acetyl-D-glucosamine synthase
MSRRYIVVTPVRNEEQFLPLTIQSMENQTVIPERWIIVDDGSTDSTAKIAQCAAERNSWIRPVRRVDRGFRLSGSGVMDAFYDGLQRNDVESWDFLAKLDGDLSFESTYFQRCLDHFESNRKLGIGGGTICKKQDNVLLTESPKDPTFHVRGAVKMYRRACWEAIGGLVKGPCWDSIDELKGNMLGWQTNTFQELRVHHHRPAGQAFGKWKDWVKGGRGNYVTGYHPVFMLAKCLKRLKRQPIGPAGYGLMYGYIAEYIKRSPRLVDAQLMKYVRDQQLRSLIGQSSLWNNR